MTKSTKNWDKDRKSRLPERKFVVWTMGDEQDNGNPAPNSTS